MIFFENNFFHNSCFRGDNIFSLLCFQMTVNQVLALLAALTLVFTFADVLINRNCFTDLKMNVKLERHLYLENLEIPGSLFRQNHMAGNPSMPVYQWNGTFSESDVCNHPEAINRNRLYFYGYYPMFLYS